MELTEVSYGRRLTEIATERPDDVDLVLVAEDGTESDVPWREMETRANQIARLLQNRDVNAGSIVTLALPSGIEHILVTLAVWKLGATLLPLRHDMPQWEMDRLLDLAAPGVVVSDAHVAACPVLTRADLAATVDLPSDPLPDVISECLNLTASSGSTGYPKLIRAPARGVVADDPQSATVRAGLTPTILVTSPLYHVNGFLFTAPPLLEGARLYVMEKFDAALAVELIERHQITLTVMVPTMLQRIARLDKAVPERFRSIERLVYGGSTIPEWVVERWLELIPPERFVFSYGSSERLGLVTMPGSDWAAHRGATGRPVDVELSIRGPGGDELPAGEVGDIYMRPLDPDRAVFSYIGMPSPAPTADGYYTIGDMGWLDADGYLYIADRRKDMIVTGGANVFPAEVEAALSEHSSVVDQVVVPVPDEEWGHRVHAIIQPADIQDPPDVEQLREHCRARLAAYKVPKSFELVEKMARTEAGKLNRTSLGADRTSA